MSKRIEVGWEEVASLALHILQVEAEETDNKISLAEEELMSKWGIDIDIFQEIIESIYPLININVSSLTGKVYSGFFSETEAFVKKDVTNRHLGAMVAILENSENKSLLIKKSDKPRFIISLKDHEDENFE